MSSHFLLIRILMIFLLFFMTFFVVVGEWWRYRSVCVCGFSVSFDLKWLYSVQEINLGPFHLPPAARPPTFTARINPHGGNVEEKSVYVECFLSLSTEWCAPRNFNCKRPYHLSLSYQRKISFFSFCSRLFITQPQQSETTSRKRPDGDIRNVWETFFCFFCPPFPLLNIQLYL